MLRKSDFQGSIRELSHKQLCALSVKLQYRGLTATGAAVRREIGRRSAEYARAHDLVLSPAHIKSITDLGADVTGIRVNEPLPLTEQLARS